MLTSRRHAKTKCVVLNKLLFKRIVQKDSTKQVLSISLILSKLTEFFRAGTESTFDSLSELQVISFKNNVYFSKPVYLSRHLNQYYYGLQHVG